MSLWKYLFLATLTLLVWFLVHVNYILLNELGIITSPSTMAESMMKQMTSTTTMTTKTKGEDAALQKRLHNLRKDVSSMKKEIHKMRSVLENAKRQRQRQQEQNDDEGNSGDGDDDDDDDVDDASEDGGAIISSGGKPSSRM